jgi:hypothetical protein
LEVNGEGRTGNGGQTKGIMKTILIKVSILKYFNKMRLIIHALRENCHSILDVFPIFEN